MEADTSPRHGGGERAVVSWLADWMVGFWIRRDADVYAFSRRKIPDGIPSAFAESNEVAVAAAALRKRHSG
jgi:hypothetical protein